MITIDSSWTMSFRFQRSFWTMRNSRSGRSSRPGSQMWMSGGRLTRSGPGGPGCCWTERTGTRKRSRVPSLQATLPVYLTTLTLLSQQEVEFVLISWLSFCRSVYLGSSPSVSISSSPAPSTSFYSPPEAHGLYLPSTPSSSTNAPSPWTPRTPATPWTPSAPAEDRLVEEIRLTVYNGKVPSGTVFKYGVKQSNKVVCLTDDCRMKHSKENKIR